ncbi:class I adenylate-forming enzyme family protein [Paenibacillus sp. MSJ-34]|uniref:class I adenylate-forming enzyme family protein n=1 Tax=Paenibacillus sp. MSJ-34 TaxID=2841529 RepID=UPI001C115F61|nr:class I adenylate-forming enzyme family protein [Paenibacillus sp. MSJ-34]MBU5441004.1 acyl--CoA ligase [Paenibacillus sp. MSJ-34]
MTILDELKRQTEYKPGRTFLTTDDRVYSYKEFYRCSASFAGYLREIYHVQPGQRIVLCFPNEADYLVAYFAVWMLEAIVVPVDFDCKGHFLRQILQDAEPALFIHNRQRSFDEICESVPILPFPNPTDYMNRTLQEDWKLSSSMPALIMYTSGTTAMPKGVVLSHGNIMFTTRRIIEWADMASTDRELTALRLTHSFGLGHVHCYVMLGAELVLIDSVREPQRLFEYMNKYRVTGMPATPALIRMLVEYYRNDLIKLQDQLHYIVINTAPIDVNLLYQLLELLPRTRIYMYYGLTEASRSTYIAYRKHLDKLASVGRPPQGVEVRLDPGNREIQIRGNNVMLGYLNHQDSFLPDGWFGTGDIGRFDEEGFLYIEGRLKEQINVDGLKINPAEVENVIRKHIAVEDCAVFGVSDMLTFEKVVAVVVCREGYTLDFALSGEIKRMCKHELEFYKIPRMIQQWTAVPRTDTGKLKRQQAKALWEKGEKL